MPNFKSEFNSEERVALLQEGDIMLKRNLDGFKSDPIGCTISFMQGITVSSGQNLPGAYISGHAAIFVGGDQIAEATGDGVGLTNLEDVKHTRYIIYRCHNQNVAQRAARYARQLTQRHRAVDGSFLDGNYRAGFSDGAAGSLFKSRHMGDKGGTLMNHVNQFLNQPAANLAVPNFFCSMFVFVVYEVALGENHRFHYDPYSVDPKFYHKILHSRPDLYNKVGKYIHVHSNGQMKTECLQSVREALVNYRTLRQNQSFQLFRSRSDASQNAIQNLQELVDLCSTQDVTNEGYIFLISASLYYTRNLSELPKFFPDIVHNLANEKTQFSKWFGAQLDLKSTLLTELDKTSFFRRLRSVRNS